MIIVDYIDVTGLVNHYFYYVIFIILLSTFHQIIMYFSSIFHLHFFTCIVYFLLRTFYRFYNFAIYNL